jgi:protein-S-isoprenylcysteine O-methyltransferase Ste14
MSENSGVTELERREDPQPLVVERVIQVVVQAVVLWAVLFAFSGDLSWGWGWAYVGVGMLTLVINILVLPPEVVAERGRTRKQNVKVWDKVLAPAAGVWMLVVPVVAGLDRRYGWPPEMVATAQVAGLVLIALGQALFTWGMASNRFFSTAVRMQTDRDHAVVSGGPYRYVRHPGYVGYVVSQVATPLALGSVWAIIPAGLGAVLVVVRTALEDRMLQKELAGYTEYCQHVPYRLLPGIW